LLTSNATKIFFKYLLTQTQSLSSKSAAGNSTSRKSTKDWLQYLIMIMLLTKLLHRRWGRMWARSQMKSRIYLNTTTEKGVDKI